MSKEWVEEFALRDVNAQVAVRRDTDGIVHVEVPCLAMIQVKGSCVDAKSRIYEGLDTNVVSTAGKALEFILNHVLVDHLSQEKCKTCIERVPPELLAMSYGACEMRTIITGLKDKGPEDWQKAWMRYADQPFGTLPIVILFKLIYPKAGVEEFFPFRKAGAMIVWKQEMEDRSHEG